MCHTTISFIMTYVTKTVVCLHGNSKNDTVSWLPRKTFREFQVSHCKQWLLNPKGIIKLCQRGLIKQAQAQRVACYRPSFKHHLHVAPGPPSHRQRLLSSLYGLVILTALLSAPERTSTSRIFASYLHSIGIRYSNTLNITDWTLHRGSCESIYFFIFI